MKLGFDTSSMWSQQTTTLYVCCVNESCTNHDYIASIWFVIALSLVSIETVFSIVWYFCCYHRIIITIFTGGLVWWKSRWFTQPWILAHCYEVSLCMEGHTYRFPRLGDILRSYPLIVREIEFFITKLAGDILPIGYSLCVQLHVNLHYHRYSLCY